MRKIFFMILAALCCVAVVSCSCTDEETEGDLPLDENCEHYWDGGKILKEATVHEVGEISYSCVLCKGTRRESIPKLSHNHVYTSEWESDRMNHWHACQIEGCTVKGSKGSHTWDKGEILVESNPTVTGKKLFRCTVCSFEKEEDYRANAQITRAEFSKAIDAGAFGNVTVSDNGSTIEIDGNLVRCEGVVSDNLGNMYGFLFASMLKDVDYSNLSYDEATRAYFCEANGKIFTLQFADGRLWRCVINDGNTVNEFTFTKYGKTVIE